MSKKRKESCLWNKFSFSQTEVEEKKHKKDRVLLRKSNSFAFENKILTNRETGELKDEFKKNCANWIEKFTPDKIEDLAVHNKKVEEVNKFLQHCDFMIKKKLPNQIGLFTGPSGVGKTAALRILAKNLGFQIREWITPVDIEFDNSGLYSVKESQITLFKRFIFQSSRYKSLFESSEKRILLVEDFPNSIIRDSSLLYEILEYYKIHGKSPAVFIVTDSRSRELNISYNLFPDLIKEKFEIMHISFNAVAYTLMKKALKRITSQIAKDPNFHSYNTPNEDTLNSICITAEGDIRNAVINLYFASLKGAKKLLLNDIENTKNKKNKKLLSLGRDPTMTLMHALGRVFHPKYKEINEKRILLHSPEELTDQFSMERKNFVDFIHSNYIPHFADIIDVLTATENLSLSDNLMSEYRDDNLGSIGLNIAIRSLMVSNTSGWVSLRGRNKQSRDNSYFMELNKYGISSNISKNVFVTDMRSYLKIIKN